MMDDPVKQFELACRDEIAHMAQSADLQDLTRRWFEAVNQHRYSYHFRAFGQPVIQYPQDIVAVQELIWRIKPDLIIETGVAHGGSLLMSAGQLAVLDYCDAAASGKALDIDASRRRVLGIDIDIRAHNRHAIEQHPLSRKIDLIEGSSVDSNVIKQVYSYCSKFNNILVLLDSNHTHNHVLADLEAYAPLTSKESYCIVFDTIIDEMKSTDFLDRPWHPGNSPKTAVKEYLKRLDRDSISAIDGEALLLTIDWEIGNKLLVTVAPDGYLRRR